MKYYAASVEFSVEGKENIITIKDEISKEEFDKLFDSTRFLDNIGATKEAYKIAVQNGKELEIFLSDSEMKRNIFVEQNSPSNFVTNANRLTYNFCASIKTFVDYATISVKRKGENKFKSFDNLLKRIFDESIEYRFFYKLRNYIIHYSYPFTTLEVAMPDKVNLVCKKEHLLKYDGWGAILKQDFLTMPNCIDIRQYIEGLVKYLNIINLTVYYHYAHDYCNASTNFADFQKKYNLAYPTTISIENEKERIHPLPIEAIRDGIRQLEINPKINLEPIS